MASRKMAWVTGAGTGIGREVARRLALDGWQVAVSARTNADLDSLAREVPDAIHSFPLDITDRDSVNAVATQIRDTLGPLDLVILSAGTYVPMSAKDFDVDGFAKTIDVNLMGTVNCLAAVMPPMIARQSGHIAVVASVSGFVGLPAAGAYGASKAALNNLCEALQPDLARYGVRLSVINPGFVDTPLTKKNDFPMPFLIPVEQAGDAIMAGLKTDRFEIVFPWQMSVAMKTLALLPHGLRLAITKRMLR
ncbi:NAD(P)-dependent dehydrogenase (short-subunit alcohol dehydrogenase family) [Devosia sp. UYZn731]|uniref:SDR family NAD(P)-dependent oxidoreductase n=1 Tax=Devosia sp. UYZn731 TaxID=3156345 RepID=UPI00339288C4